MKESRDNVMEQLRIQHALAAAGYFAYIIEKRLGTGTIKIEARLYVPGNDERIMLRDAKTLFDDGSSGLLQTSSDV